MQQAVQQGTPKPKKTVAEFASIIKAKFPQYQDRDDYELVNKIIEKHPEYRDKIAFEQMQEGVVQQEAKTPEVYTDAMGIQSRVIEENPLEIRVEGQDVPKLNQLAQTIQDIQSDGNFEASMVSIGNRNHYVKKINNGLEKRNSMVEEINSMVDKHPDGLPKDVYAKAVSFQNQIKAIEGEVSQAQKVLEERADEYDQSSQYIDNFNNVVSEYNKVSKDVKQNPVRVEQLKTDNIAKTVSNRFQQTLKYDYPSALAAEEVIEARKPSSIISLYEDIKNNDVDTFSGMRFPWASDVLNEDFLTDLGFSKEEIDNIKRWNLTDVSSITPEMEARAQELAGLMDEVASVRANRDIELDGIRAEILARQDPEEKKKRDRARGQYEVDPYFGKSDLELEDMKAQIYQTWLAEDAKYKELESEFAGIMKPVYQAVAPVHAKIMEAAVRMQEEGEREYGMGVVKEWDDVDGFISGVNYVLGATAASLPYTIGGLVTLGTEMIDIEQGSIASDIYKTIEEESGVTIEDLMSSGMDSEAVDNAIKKGVQAGLLEFAGEVVTVLVPGAQGAKAAKVAMPKGKFMKFLMAGKRLAGAGLLGAAGEGITENIQTRKELEAVLSTIRKEDGTRYTPAEIAEMITWEDLKEATIQGAAAGSTMSMISGTVSEIIARHAKSKKVANEKAKIKAIDQVETAEVVPEEVEVSEQGHQKALELKQTVDENIVAISDVEAIERAEMEDRADELQAALESEDARIAEGGEPALVPEARQEMEQELADLNKKLQPQNEETAQEATPQEAQETTDQMDEVSAGESVATEGEVSVEGETSEVEVIKKNTEESLSEVSPGTKVNVAESEEDYNNRKSGDGNATMLKDENGVEFGEYNPNTDEILLNPDKATKATGAHEGLHAILSAKVKESLGIIDTKKITPEQAKQYEESLNKASENLLASLKRAMPSTGKQAQALSEMEEKVRLGYEQGQTAEETLANVVGYLAENFSSFDRGAIQQVKIWINEIAKAIGLSDELIKGVASDEQVRMMVNSLAENFAAGAKITEESLNPVKEALAAGDKAKAKAEIEAIEKSSPEPETSTGVTNSDAQPTGVSVKKSLIEDLGLVRHTQKNIKTDAELKDFPGIKSHLTFSDRLVKGLVGDREYLGGVLFPEDNLFWAAGKKGSAMRIINAAEKNADGYRYMNIAIGSQESHMSNKDMLLTSVELVEKEINSKNISPREAHDRIQKALSKKALKKFLPVYRRENKGKITSESIISGIDKTVLSDNATFPERKSFLESLLGNAEKNEKQRFGSLPTFTKLAAGLAEPITEGHEYGDIIAMARTKGDLSTVEKKKGEKGYHPSYKYIIESSDDVELIIYKQAYSAKDVYPSITTRDGKTVTYEDYVKTYGDNAKQRYLNWIGGGQMSTAVSEQVNTEAARKNKITARESLGGTIDRTLDVKKSKALEDPRSDFEKKNDRMKADNYMNIVEGYGIKDGENNLIFRNFGRSRKENLKPGTTKGSLHTSREEQSAINSVGGITMFYAKEGMRESGVGDVLHEVSIPKDKVYIFNSDADGFYWEAQKRFNKRFPGQAFTPNHQVAWITKVANENGYDIVLAKWRRNDWRGHTTLPLEPMGGRVSDNIASLVTEAHSEFGGSAISQDGKNLYGNKGFAVSPFKENERKVKDKAVANDQVTKYAKENWKLLRDQENFVGTWYNEDDGNTYLDVSIFRENYDDAVNIAKKHNQLAIFNLETGEEIVISDENSGEFDPQQLSIKKSKREAAIKNIISQRAENESQARKVIDELNKKLDNKIGPDLAEKILKDLGFIAKKKPKAKSEPKQKEIKERTVAKKVATRSYEGDFRNSVKRHIQRLGLNRIQQNQDQAFKDAQELVDNIGIDAALDAVRNFDIAPSAITTFIYAIAIEDVQNQQAQTTNELESNQLAILEAKLVMELDAMGVGGGQQSAAFNYIYQNLSLGFNAERAIREWEEQFGYEPSEEVKQKYKDYEKRITELTQRVNELEQEEQQKSDQDLIQSIVESIARQNKPKAKHKNAKKALEVVGTLRKKLRANAYSDATGMIAIVDTGLGVIEGSIKAGIQVADAIEAGVRYIKAKLKEQGVDTWEKENQFRQDVEREFSAAGVKSTTKKASFDETTGKIKIPEALIRELVEDGNITMEGLVEAIKEQIIEDFPDVSDREIRDAITGYGKVVNMKKDEVSTLIRKLKRIGKITSALEDIREKKKRPKRSGRQRDKLDAEERAKQKELREALKELPPDMELLAEELKTATDAYKTRLQNRIEDLQREIDNKERVPKSKRAIQDDQEIKDLRNKLAEKKKEHDEAFKEENKKIREAKRLELLKRNTDRAIQDLKERIINQDFSKKERPKPVSDTELTKKRGEKLRLQESFNKLAYMEELSNRSKAQKAKDSFWDLWNVSRVLMATGEFSFVLIQGLSQTVAHPVNAFKSLMTAFKFMASASRTEKFLDNLRGQDYWDAMSQSRLAITTPHAELEAREELYYSDWANMILDKLFIPLKWIAGEKAYEKAKEYSPLRAIERAAIGYLNSVRVYRFLDGKAQLESQGITFEGNPEAYKQMADVVNTLTGRASLGAFEQNSKFLAKMFFSPRNWASAIKLGTPYAMYYIARQSAGAEKGSFKPTVQQKMAVADMSKTIGAISAVVMAAALKYNNDDDDETGVSFDPTSSDFLKIKIGDRRIDLWGGKVQQVVWTARVANEALKLMGLNIKERLGIEEDPDKNPIFAPTVADYSVRMALNKLAPTASLALEMATARREDGVLVDAWGNEIDMWDELTERAIPIYATTFKELQADGIDAAEGFLLFLGFFGAGLQEYGELSEGNVKRIMERRKKAQQKRLAPPVPQPPKPLPNLKEEAAAERKIKKYADKYKIQYVPPALKE
jgi:hypothetical protein